MFHVFQILKTYIYIFAIKQKKKKNLHIYLYFLKHIYLIHQSG